MRRRYIIIFAAIFLAIAPASLYAQVQVDELALHWNGRHWENSDNDTDFIYNNDCQLLYSLLKTWDSSANTWDNEAQYYWSYNGIGKVYQDSAQLWNYPASGWNNSEVSTFTYDGSNYLINEFNKTWSTATSSWQNIEQNDYINNTDGTPHIVYSLTWSGSAWDSSEIQTYIYNTPGQLDTELTIERISSVWQNSNRNYYIYTSGYATVVTQTWSATSNSWQNAELQNWFPNLTLPDSVKYSNWNTITNIWDTSLKAIYTYAPCTPAAVRQINVAEPIAVYPNPTTGYFTITGLTQGQTVEIYNYTGQRIESRIANNATMDFNIATYAGGMYLVRVQNQGGSIAAQKKMVKIQ